MARFRDAHFAANEAALIKAMVEEEVWLFSGRARLEAALKLPTKADEAAGQESGFRSQEVE